jgi:hypothetical protein
MPDTETKPETRTYKWAHHTTWEGKDVLPGDEVEMDAETARGYIGAGMLQVDPENPVAVAEALGTPLPPAPVDLGKTAGEITALMATMSAADLQATIAAEKAGQNRKSIIEYQRPTP